MIETADDRALFFDPAGFGEEVLVKIGDGPAFAISAIYDERPPFTATNFKGFKGTDDFGRGMGDIAGAQPRIIAETTAVAGVKGGRATITVRGKDYIAHRTTPDGTGLTIVELKIA